MSDKVKPCPFCGGKAYIREESDAFSGIYNVVRCEKCLVDVITYVDMPKDIDYNKGRAIEAWNKRSNPWQTGIPTEDGEYLVFIKWRKSGHMQYEILHFSTETDEWTGDFMPMRKVIAYQKIEPYGEGK